MFVATYHIKSEEKCPKKHLRAALVTDLHDKDPADVLSTLRELSPDLIFLAGDLMERHKPGALMYNGQISPYTVEIMDEWMGISSARHLFTKVLKFFDGSLKPEKSEGKKWDKKNGYTFLAEANRIAPLYYSVGNHEWYFTARDMEIIRESGTRLLDNEDCLIEEYGIRIGGLSTRYDRDWLDSYARKEGFKLLLCHHPDYVEKYVREKNAGFLILSGHVHGGQIRFFNRGLFAPGQGFLPKYHHGEYRIGREHLIVSAGCVNTVHVPRFFNPCEVVCLEIDFKGKEGKNHEILSD